MKKIVVCAILIMIILSLSLSGIFAQDNTQDKKTAKKVEKTCCGTEKKAEQKSETACGGCATEKPTCSACPAASKVKVEKKAEKKENKK